MVQRLMTDEKYTIFLSFYLCFISGSEIVFIGPCISQEDLAFRIRDLASLRKEIDRKRLTREEE